MYSKGKFGFEEGLQPVVEEQEFDLARWTSDVYLVQFGQVDTVSTLIDDEALFRNSGWGISEVLRTLLADYQNQEVRNSVEWATARQAGVVNQIVEDLRYHPGGLPSLEDLFVGVDTELFMPRGLRMPVTCVTNIVPYGIAAYGLDKFVAVLDPGEVDMYILERKGTGVRSPGERLH